MSLFQYKITLTGGKIRAGQITAKTEALARERLAKQFSIVSWQSIREKPVQQSAPGKSPQPVKPAPVAKPISAKAATRLEKLLYLQSSKCFFCGRVLTKAEASVEHLLPKSKGGSDADGNVVACCVALNRTFGSMELKEKVRIILDKAGKFTCPKP
jgi:hypothetical protein